MRFTLRCCILSLPLLLPSLTLAAGPVSGQEAARERNACVNDATAKFKRGTDGPQGSYEIWRVELQRCEDLMMSRLVAEKMKGVDCSPSSNG
jgi:hypothetical protein